MSVGRICTREVDTVRFDESALEAARRMRDRQVGSLVVVDENRLPVVGIDGGLLGILALDDVLELVAEELTEIGRLMKREAPHRWLGRQV